jgi:hypothetical protein
VERKISFLGRAEIWSAGNSAMQLVVIAVANSEMQLAVAAAA